MIIRRGEFERSYREVFCQKAMNFVRDHNTGSVAEKLSSFFVRTLMT
jgi:hypothetical protein